MTTIHLDEVRRRFKDPETVTPGDDVPPNDPPPRTPDEGDPEIAGAKLPLNDTGNGRRFALYYGADAMIVPRVGWHVWDGKRWQKDPDDIKVRGKAQQVQERIIAEIPHLALEDWQLREIDAEPGLRGQEAILREIDPTERTSQQQIDLEDITQRLIWIRKLKDRKSSMKSEWCCTS